MAQYPVLKVTSRKLLLFVVLVLGVNSLTGCCCKVQLFDSLIDNIVDKELRSDCLYKQQLDVSRFELSEPPRNACFTNGCRVTEFEDGQHTSPCGESCRCAPSGG